MAPAPLRLLIVTTGPPVKRLPALYTRLLDEGVELVFSVLPERLPEVIRGRASSVELPLARGDSVRTLRAAADLVRFLGPRFTGARWPRSRATRRLLKLVGHPDANRIGRASVDFEL